MRLYNSLDIEQLEEMCELLKQFKDVTLIMSSEKSSSVSLIRPLLHQLLENTKPLPDVNIPLVHQTKAAIYHDLEKR